jgi:hypothetical protein
VSPNSLKIKNVLLPSREVSSFLKSELTSEMRLASTCKSLTPAASFHTWAACCRVLTKSIWRKPSPKTVGASWAKRKTMGKVGAACVRWVSGDFSGAKGFPELPQACSSAPVATIKAIPKPRVMARFSPSRCEENGNGTRKKPLPEEFHLCSI